MKNGGETMTTDLTDEQIAAWKSAAKSVMHHPATPMNIHCHAYATFVLASEIEEYRKECKRQEGKLNSESAAVGYQPAIDILRKRAASELDGGFRAHHNALIYAANELENAQAFDRENCNG
ncbi:TPA: hypothetical protein NBQ95_004335 [Enterobacter kobei]|nr:hypothetical protein [Enterobacter kobei]